MNKKIVKAGLCSLAVVLAIASCKKPSSSASTHDKFVGQWKLHQLIFDNDGSGTINAGDIVDNADTENVIVKFNSDGTGSSTSPVDNDPFTWELTANNTYLHITGLNNSNYLQITSAPGSSFTVKDTSNSTIGWEVFNKQ